jgi:hypothetical protein
MPLQQALPTWTALNNANFNSSAPMTDQYTGQPMAGGGLNVGDYFDITTEEASIASDTANGLLFPGRYRFVQVDSGATAANVKTGTVGYMRSGSSVKSVETITVGSGQTAGTYNIAATAGSGGGSGAVIQVIVGSGGTITGNPTVVNGGFGYVSLPSFSLTALGGSAGTISVQLSVTANLVTSMDQVGVSAVAVRPVVFLNSITPGNYGFIQELGFATVLANAAVSTTTAGAYVNALTTNSGTVTCTVASGSPIGSTIGVAVDAPANGILFKAQLGYGAMVVQD